MKFACYTLGCKVNQYETQAMEQLLVQSGHTLGSFDEICDGYIINTCTVTAVSDKKSRNAIRRVRKLNPQAVVGVCGCYAQSSPDEIRKLDVDVLIGTDGRDCVGGSARAVLKLGKKYYHLPDDTNTLSSKQLNDLATLLYSGEKEATDLILKLTSDRVHTIVPGIMILQHVMNLFKAEEIIISKYGVREGYLWQKIMKKTKNNTITPKIEN